MTALHPIQSTVPNDDTFLGLWLPVDWYIRSIKAVVKSVDRHHPSNPHARPNGHFSGDCA